jgi:hypothetical protein
VFTYVNLCLLSDRQSSESLRSSWNKKLRVTSQHPFKLRTEVIAHLPFFHGRICESHYNVLQDPPVLSGHWWACQNQMFCISKLFLTNGTTDLYLRCTVCVSECELSRSPKKKCEPGRYTCRCWLLPPYSNICRFDFLHQL